MSNVYDQAHALARALRESEEYRSYAAAREIAYENDTNRTLLTEYKKLQYQLQIAMASGSAPDPAAMERLQKLSGLLQLSPESSACLLAEFRLQKMLADLYKILGDAAGIDIDALQGG